jgi:methylmalonyl-CoA/ethylmalonyl-CoA epimerase
VRLTHVGIAVRDGSVSSRLFEVLLGSQPGHREEVADQKVRTVLFDVGSAGLELLEPTSAESTVAKFIDKRGEGIHHLSFEVDDIQGEIERLRSAGFQMIDEKPRPGAGGYLVAFIHPKSTNGVLVEISQKRKG